MATHSSILTWKIPWTEEGYSPWGCQESDTNEQLNTHTHTTNLGLQNTSGDPGELDGHHPSCSGAPRGIVGTRHPKQTLESGTLVPFC